MISSRRALHLPRPPAGSKAWKELRGFDSDPSKLPSRVQGDQLIDHVLMALGCEFEGSWRDSLQDSQLPLHFMAVIISSAEQHYNLRNRLEPWSGWRMWMGSGGSAMMRVQHDLMLQVDSVIFPRSCKLKKNERRC